MPLWTWIAQTGKTRVLAHAQALAAKNILQLHMRIGDVDMTGMENLAHVSNVPRPAKFFTKQLSDRLHKKDIKELLIGPRIMSHDDEEDDEEEPSEHSAVPPATLRGAVVPQNKASSAPTLEPDPQEKPPIWRDYCIAIFYICFGVLALFEGLISLCKSGNDEQEHPDVRTIAH